jgi:uncharacterized protein (TIRG00374 family)
MKTTHQKVIVVIALLIAGLMVMVLAASLLSDFAKLQEVFRHLEFGPVFSALMTTGLAFLASALSFRTLFKMTSHRIPFPKFFSIMFIADTMNYIISSAGMSSIAIRAFFLKQEKVPYSVTIPLTLAQNMIFNLVLSFVCMGGLVYIKGHPELVGGPNQTAILFFMAGLLLFVGVMIFIFFNRAFSRWVLNQVLGTGYWFRQNILRKKGLRQDFSEIQRVVESTVTFLKKGWTHLIAVFFFIAMNWCLMALTFYFCFRSVGMELPLGLLLVGFTLMFLSSNVNPVPAGLGVSESLLAVTFKMLGVGFETTLVAALVFRLVYFLIPILISTALYLDRVRSFLKSSQMDDKN